jgi:chorismate dehydratase
METALSSFVNTMGFPQPSNGPDFLSPTVAVDSSRGLIRIGAVSYLNTKPLVFGLQESLGSQGILSFALPSQLAIELHQGNIDVGLIPAVESFRDPEYRIVSNAAIACMGPVWSVRVLFRVDPSTVKVIAMDSGSKTSIALTKILFNKRFGYVPDSIPLPMDCDPRDIDADAVLIIGDRAMHPDAYKDQFALNWDLGQAWFEETGLPFVFAMWVARNDSFDTEHLIDQLERSRTAGSDAVAQISAEACDAYRLTPTQCEDYLTNYIRFNLGPAEFAGLHEFRKCCEQLHLI